MEVGLGGDGPRGVGGAVLPDRRRKKNNPVTPAGVLFVPPPELFGIA